MKNSINYYYNISIDNVTKSDHDYYFYIDGDEFHLVLFDRPYDDIDSIYNLNKQLKMKGCLVHEIILNKDNRAITIINDIPYVLIKLCRYKNDKVFLNDINYIQNMSSYLQYDQSLLRNDWIRLWSEKIDYYEYQINQLGKKYPLLCDSLSYFIGIGENAISYLINNIDINDNLKVVYKHFNNINNNLVVSHKRINRDLGSFDFYNPLNFVADNKSRDVCEYIKNCFFNDCLDIYEVKSYLNINNFTRNDYIYMYARLLFPTYYFDVYDRIINNGNSEENIIPILEKVDKYEEFLFNIYKYILYEKKVQIEPVEWLMRNHS